MSGFEVFARRTAPLARTPHVTIQRRGTISLNASAYDAIGSPAAVELLFDAEALTIGLRGVDRDAEHAYPVRATGPHAEGPFVVSGRAFTKHYGISTEVSRRWPAAVVDEVLCVDLRDEGTVVTSNRAGSGRGGEDRALPR